MRTRPQNSGRSNCHRRMAVDQFARMDIHAACDARFECHFGRGCAELEQNLSHGDRARFGKPARPRESLRIARALAFAHACIADREPPTAPAKAQASGRMRLDPRTDRGRLRPNRARTRSTERAAARYPEPSRRQYPFWVRPRSGWRRPKKASPTASNSIPAQRGLATRPTAQRVRLDRVASGQRAQGQRNLGPLRHRRARRCRRGGCGNGRTRAHRLLGAMFVKSFSVSTGELASTFGEIEAEIDRRLSGERSSAVSGRQDWDR